jgi:ubiquinone/menaquinone biosynthesis C-methylase UbiE
LLEGGDALKDSVYLTTGQLAKRTGLTLRTLRYYDQIGLLTPSKEQSGMARRYTVEDLYRLQRIQTLKYVGLSLEEIQKLLSIETGLVGGMKDSLQVQLVVLRQKIAHTQQVVHAIRRAMEHGLHAEQSEEIRWSRLADIIQAVQKEQEWSEQYLNASRLQTRIHLYDRFSTNPQGWHRWIFDQLGQEENVHLLELGCGDGTLWVRNAERIPQSWRITLTDQSEGMVEEARARLKGLSQFKFLTVDAQDIPFHDGQFDRVIANNMLYHVPDIPQAVREIHRVLRDGGKLYASTMSCRHLQEVEQVGRSFDPELEVLDRVIERFHLDNGAELVSACFGKVERMDYVDSLWVTEAEPLIEYMTSTPMNARSRIQGTVMDRFRTYVGQLLEGEGGLAVTKENGLLIGRK